MAEEQQENRPAIRIEKIYLKDVSLETPNSPAVFTIDWKPALNIDIGQKVARLGDEGLFEVVLVLTATTKIDDKTAYLAEVHQAGIFTLPTADQEQLDRLLGVFCPRMLYPYASAALSDLVTRGGFPQLVLAPMNFDAVYQQRQQESGSATGQQA
ncbi:MAG: protein-export chaperone SecB [Thiohalobacterales bacterium]|nr:protein-export chaperone SecB [Thiohalobacterales bacterium]